MKYYCNCQSKILNTQRRKSKSKKTPNKVLVTQYYTSDLRKFHETTVDGDGCCLDCGYYATVTPSNAVPNELKWNDSRDYAVNRKRAVGAFFASQGSFTYSGGIDEQ